MELRGLGHTEVAVSPIGLGCWQFSRGTGVVGRYWPALPQTEVVDIVRASMDNGMNWFDTAEIYGRGDSERSVSDALQALGVAPSAVVIATKWWPVFRGAEAIVNTLAEREEYLQPYRVSLYQIHHPYAFATLRTQMQMLCQLSFGRRIAAPGVSNFSAYQLNASEQVMQEYGLHLASNQVSYSLFDRRIEHNGVMETARKLGISIIAYSPLAQGLLTGKYHDSASPRVQGWRRLQRRFSPAALRRTSPLIALLREVADKYQATPSQVALAWVIRFHGHSVFAVAGARTAAQARENALAMLVNLTEDDLRRLDEVSRMVCLK